MKEKALIWLDVQVNEAALLPISFRLDILQKVMEGFNHKVIIGFLSSQLKLHKNTIIYRLKVAVIFLTGHILTVYTCVC